MDQRTVVALEAATLVGLAGIVIITGTPLTRHYRWLRKHPRLKHALGAVLGIIVFHLDEDDRA